MDNERDEILNDLIDYYDNNDDDTMDNTTVVNVGSHAVHDEDISGDTVVVNVPKNKNDEIEKTMQVNIPSEEIRRAPEEEVFGNLDLAGRHIERVQPTPEKIQSQPARDIDTPNIPRSRKNTLTPPPGRKTGTWYTLKPLWVTLILCAVILGGFKFYVTDTGTIGLYKRNFSYNLSLILRVFGIEPELDETPTVGDDNKLSNLLSSTGLVMTAYAEESDEIRYKVVKEAKASVPFPGADLAKFQKYDDGVVSAKSNYICYINKKGDKEWEYTTPISDPILRTAGKYIVVAAANSTQLSLYKGKELMFSIDTPSAIKTCSVSEKGDVAIVTDKTAYKGAVSVYNKNGEEIFNWLSGVNYITSATITEKRQVSVSLVSVENPLTSFIMVFDIFTPDPLSGVELPDTLVYYTSSYKGNTYACGDNSISSINDSGNLNYNIKFDNMIIKHTSADKNGWRLASYTDNHLPYMNIYNRHGKLRYSIPTEVSPDFADLYKSVILYNNGRDIICGRASDVKKTKYSAPMSVKNLVMIDKNTYMVAYENSLEFVNI